LPPVTVYESEFATEETEIVTGKQTTVRRENNTFYVEGEWLINLMGQVNFDNYESLNFFQRALINGGVIKLLEEKGCTDGDTVNIYDFEFDFVK
jgi:GTP-binding protein